MRLSVLILLICGCSRGEDALTTSARDTISKTLSHTKYIVFDGVAFAADGGSILFRFKTDQGAKVNVLALHRNKDMGGNPTYQELRVSGSTRGEFELTPYSSLEKQIILLLEGSTNADGSEQNLDMEKPTRERLAWLLSRTKDRTLRWSRLP